MPVNCKKSHPGSTGHATLTLKLYLMIFWGAWGLLAVRTRVISSFNSFGMETK